MSSVSGTTSFRIPYSSLTLQGDVSRGSQRGKSSVGNQVDMLIDSALDELPEGADTTNFQPVGVTLSLGGSNITTAEQAIRDYYKAHRRDFETLTLVDDADNASTSLSVLA
jgi:hypothetical protein